MSKFYELNKETLEFSGRRVFKDHKFVGWIVFAEFKYMSAGVSDLIVYIARIDTLDKYNVYRYRITPPLAIEAYQEIRRDPIQEYEGNRISSFFNFKYNTKI